MVKCERISDECSMESGKGRDCLQSKTVSLSMLCECNEQREKPKVLRAEHSSRARGECNETGGFASGAFAAGLSDADGTKKRFCI